MGQKVGDFDALLVREEENESIINYVTFYFKIICI